MLQITEHELTPPARNHLRLRILAASISCPDVTVRNGNALYSGTPLGKKPPFVPGYSLIGEVDAVGDGVRGFSIGDRGGALTVTGGYSEHLYWRADRLIPVPEDLDPTNTVPVFLNYIVAWQTMHRKAAARHGESALIIGASGGIGTVLLQLARLSSLRMYSVASWRKHSVVEAHGVVPIDYHNEDFAEVISRSEPGDINIIFDGMRQPDTSKRCLPLLAKGGRIVSFGEPSSFSDLWRILRTQSHYS